MDSRMPVPEYSFVGPPAGLYCQDSTSDGLPCELRVYQDGELLITCRAEVGWMIDDEAGREGVEASCEGVR